MVRGLIFCLVALAASCTGTSYVAQAGIGQLNLFARARDLDKGLADPNIDPRKLRLLSEVSPVLRYARQHGLDTKGNYRKYVDLPRGAVVWFTAAAPALSLEPKKWSFPIVGSFTYLGWFDFVTAMRFRRRLERDGFDVYLRGVRAYSTGGWFRDPVLSTMLPHRDDHGTWYLVNVLFHELTHANILINDQSTFNESVASFVGDTMAEEYLVWRFGKDSPELEQFREELAEDLVRGEQLTAAYAQLDALYKSSASKKKKMAVKRKVLDKLEDELGLRATPNNAMLAGFRTYNAGMKEFRQLYEHCGRDWKPFLRVVKAIDEDDFKGEQVDAIGPVIAARLRRPCASR